jgi:hypothetical protein
MLGYDNPILQREQPSGTYYRAEVNPSGLKPTIANPIAIPTNVGLTTPGEDFGTLKFVDDPFEPRVSQAQVEEELKELVGHALEEIRGDVNEEEKVVEGFEEGFELLDHQVLARRWMRDRETGKKFGGILADDMGCVFPMSFGPLCLTTYLCRLGKTIQMLARICDGLPSREDRKDGWAKSTL